MSDLATPPAGRDADGPACTAMNDGAAPRALVVAIVGAESTGKSRLAQALVDRLDAEFGLRGVAVGEYLREWCDQHGRTPRAEEQAGIAHEQQRRAEAAAARPDVDVVVCDTMPLMVSVYSDLLFDDRSLDGFAADCQRRVDLTLLTALDLPWTADGIMRDGPHVREPVDAHVRARLLAWGLGWAIVAGQGEARTARAVEALRPLLLRRALRQPRGSGLFSRFEGSRIGPPAPAWTCERCDEPGCEHLARTATPRR